MDSFYSLHLCVLVLNLVLVCHLQCAGFDFNIDFEACEAFQDSSLTGSDWERNLVYDLFEGPGYNPLIRPVQNISETAVKVSFGITMFQVISIDERTQVMKTNNWIRMMWYDYQLKWDPNMYGGIKAIRLPCDQVWKPDIVLLNNADGKYEQSFCCQTVVYSNGMVLWIPPAIYKSSCTIDVQYFPFDQQECMMKFGSWTFLSSQVEMAFLDDRDKCDLSNYVFSGTWDLMGCPAFLGPLTKKYSEINYSIILRRKTLFFTVNLLTPCVLISFLSVLTFYLPADAQEKVTLCISILLALVVFLLLVSKSLPPTSVTIPLISKYLFFTFIMNIVTVVISVIIININFRSPRMYKMPRFVRIIFLNWLPVLMFMTRPDQDMRYRKWRQRKSAARVAANGSVSNRQNSSIEESGYKFSEPTSQDDDQDSRFLTTSFMSKNSAEINAKHLSPRVIEAAEAVNYITRHMRNRDDYDEICHDWKFVASVIDRFLLYVFLSITICGTISIIVDAPHIFEIVSQEDVVNEIQSG